MGNRVAVAVGTTGTGTVTVGAALSNAFCTPAEAGVANGSVHTWMLNEGNDFQIFRGTYSTAGPTVSRDTTILSKIGGTAGTANMNLAGAAELRLVATDAVKHKFTATGDGATTAFDLTVPLFDAGDVLWFEDGVAQRPDTDYTVSGTTVTRTTAPLSGAVIHGIVYA